MSLRPFSYKIFLEPDALTFYYL